MNGCSYCWPLSKLTSSVKMGWYLSWKLTSLENEKRGVTELGWPWKFTNEQNINEQGRYLGQISKTRDLEREDEWSSVHCTLVDIQGDSQLCPARLCSTVVKAKSPESLGWTLYSPESTLHRFPPFSVSWGQGTKSKLLWRANQEEGRTNWLREVINMQINADKSRARGIWV